MGPRLEPCPTAQHYISLVICLEVCGKSYSIVGHDYIDTVVPQFIHLLISTLLEITKGTCTRPTGGERGLEAPCHKFNIIILVVMIHDAIF